MCWLRKLKLLYFLWALSIFELSVWHFFSLDQRLGPQHILQFVFSFPFSLICLHIVHVHQECGREHCFSSTLCFRRPSFTISCAFCFFPTHFEFTGNHSVCLLQRGTQDNKGQSRVLFTVHKSSVRLYTQWCVEVARQWGRLVEKNCLSICFKWTHTHLELLNLISAVLFVLLCTLKWWDGWLWSAPPIHHKGQTDELQACYGTISLMLLPLIMTVLCSHCA